MGCYVVDVVFVIEDFGRFDVSYFVLGWDFDVEMCFDEFIFFKGWFD